MTAAGIDALLDTVQWRELPKPLAAIVGDPGALYATHEGVLRVAALELRCYVLNDGQRVFSAEDIEATFGVGEQVPVEVEVESGSCNRCDGTGLTHTGAYTYDGERLYSGPPCVDCAKR